MFGDTKNIPVLLFGNEVNMVIPAGPIQFESAIFLSDPSDSLSFRGTDAATRYEGGRGAVILAGEKLFLYHLTLPGYESSQGNTVGFVLLNVVIVGTLIAGTVSLILWKKRK